MKRTLFKSSSLKVTSAFAIASMLGGAAFAGPDNPKVEADEAKTNVERIVVEEKTTIDATVMPNDADEANTSTHDAESIDAKWSLDTSAEASESAVIELPVAEEDALNQEAGDIVIESPETVVISNPDEVIEMDTSEELAPED